MTKQVKRPVLTFIAAIMTITLLAGCIVHVGSSKAKANVSFDKDYSAVNKSLTIDKGKTIGDASAVNGHLTIKDNVTAQDVSSVNGRLSIGDKVSLHELSTVNGKIVAGRELLVQSDVSTVNGKITLAEKSVVKGGITSVNGKIELDGVLVEHDIETVNASITLMGETHIKGNIIYKSRNNNYNHGNHNRLPVLRISKNVRVDGNIILESPVDLKFEDITLKSKVIEKFNQQ